MQLRLNAPEERVATMAREIAKARPDFVALHEAMILRIGNPPTTVKLDLLQSMPDQNYFWDRLTMEFRRVMSMQKTLSLLLVKAKSTSGPGKKDEANSAAWGYR